MKIHQSVDMLNKSIKSMLIEEVVELPLLPQKGRIVIKDGVMYYYTGIEWMSLNLLLNALVDASNLSNDNKISWRAALDLYNKSQVDANLNLKEDKSDKQNNLTPDGTGVKYPTVDAVNAGLNTKLNNPEVATLGDVLVKTEDGEEWSPRLKEAEQGITSALTTLAGVLEELADHKLNKANKDASAMSAGNIISWRDALDIYRKRDIDTALDLKLDKPPAPNNVPTRVVLADGTTKPLSDVTQDLLNNIKALNFQLINGELVVQDGSEFQVQLVDNELIIN
jgi:hypothetical protein